MEKKKNNAVEKAENATVKQSKSTASAKKSKKPTAKKSVKHARPKWQVELAERKKKRLALKEKRTAERAEKKAEEEKIRAEKRVELARIKAHKKAEKEKAKATALREKNRRKAEYKAKRQQLKAEREERRELLKNESKKERSARIAREKQARREEREKIRAERASEREKKREARQKRRESRKGLGGWIAAVISLGVATLVLSSVLTFTFLMPTETDNMLDSTYQKSFFDTVDQVDNIDLNLSKILATEDTSAMQKYLVDTAINSELAENDLQQLPLMDESKFYTTKLINQIGDYAKYLNNKIIAGEELTESDFDGLRSLYQANRTLKDTLQKTTAEMGEDYNFSAMLKGGDGDIVISNFNALENLSVEYPELIYDGPFSDGQAEREIKGLSGDEIDKDSAIGLFKELFSDFNLENVKAVGEVTSGNISAFNVQGEKDGELVFAQITKKGGKLLMFDYAGSCSAVNIERDVAVESAQAFIEKNSISGMKPVWINLANNVYTINFAFEQDGVIVYSDLIKVRVCAQTQKVIGFEAKSYYTNHTERMIESAVLTEKTAAEKVSSNIGIVTSRLALVPVGLKSEKLCYEFSGEFDGSTYYVYIDAMTGRQVEMFKVIESTEGQLMM